MVDKGSQVNIMTKMEATRLELRYTPSNAQLKIVNGPLNLESEVGQGVCVTLGECQCKTKFTIAPLHLFDIILGQDFFK